MRSEETQQGRHVLEKRTMSKGSGRNHRNTEIDDSTSVAVATSCHVIAQSFSDAPLNIHLHLLCASSTPASRSFVPRRTASAVVAYDMQRDSMADAHHDSTAFLNDQCNEITKCLKRYKCTVEARVGLQR